MRDIKFRGKRIDNGKWADGYLIQKNDVDAECITESYIIDRNEFTMSCDFNTRFIDLEPIKIDPETVGQFTGLKDKNGKEIWEGDIVKVIYKETRKFNDIPYEDNFKDIEEIIFLASTFMLKVMNENIPMYRPLGDIITNGQVSIKSIEIIGNISDNPELIKGE